MGGPEAASDALVLNVKETVGGDDLKKKKDEVEFEAVGCLNLFKYASFEDKMYLLAGAVSSVGLGAIFPLFIVFLGSLFNEFNDPTNDIIEVGNRFAFLFGMASLGAFLSSFCQNTGFTVASERITLRMRQLYLNAILRQDITWFDTEGGSSGLSSSIAENTVVIREGMAKSGEMLQFLTMFFAGFSIGFVYSWQISLVICSIAPLLAISGAVMAKMMGDLLNNNLSGYSKAGSIAEETFSMIRTVAAYSQEKFMRYRYAVELGNAEQAGIKKARGQGFAMGFNMLVYFSAYGLTFWYGAKRFLKDRNEAASAFPPNNISNPGCFVGNELTQEEADLLLCSNVGYSGSFRLNTPADVCSCLACACGCTVTGDCLEGGDVLLTFFAVLIGAFALGQAAPAISSFNNARAAATKIFTIIDREPDIDSDADTGETLKDIKGDIVFSNVDFAYPTRPNLPVFTQLNLKIPANKTTALVGGSGSGKSTVVQLLERFYDPSGGRITLDGHDLRDLNLRWLRDEIGLVSQEPVLFATSIAQNIAHGADLDQNVSEEDIVSACKAANAYNFIMDMPNGLETFVGERGSTMSGGQKQRIAIARALLRDPSILILDEATSALDNESERVVQEALNQLLEHKHRTTIVIAHRLTTVRKAHKIVVLGQGQGVLEEGSHEQLLQQKGHYLALLTAAKRTERDGPVHHHAPGQEDDGKEEEGEPDSLDDFDPSLVTPQILTSELHEDDSASTTETDEEDPKQTKKGQVSLRRIFQFSAPEKVYYLPAILSAAVQGAILPLFAILFAEITNVYFLPNSELIQDEANFYSVLFVALAVPAGLSNFGMFAYFGLISEKMTTRIRIAVFNSIIRQDIAFFDKKSNSVGALASKLGTDASLVKASLTDRTMLGVQNLTTVILGFTIAFYFGWLLTLILLAFIPLLIFSGMAQIAALGGLAKQDEKALEEAGQLLQESIHGIRTVTAFSLRPHIVALYSKALQKPSRLAIRKGFTIGAGVGLGQAIQFLLYGAAFFAGSRLIVNRDYTFQQVLNVFFAIAFVGIGAGTAAALAPDVGKGAAASASIFKLLDAKSKIDPDDEGGLRGGQVDGSGIDFNFSFAYPTRPNVPVLQDFKLRVEAGENVALVGMSGSGKSTTVQLLERFYDPTDGSILFKGKDLRDINVKWLRSRIGYIEQEPKLFAGSIFDNIRFGIHDDDLPLDRIEEAAKAANAHDFIMEFPNGYQTDTGSNGSQLSGGQKQRICLARMLLREDVDVYLLDEATSALDDTSEALVQEAIDRIAQNRPEVTTITIAHKLKTIENASLICLVHRGKIVEKGTHSSLIAKNGPYSKLYKAQKKSNN